MNPLRITVLQAVSVTPTVAGGSGNRTMFVIDLVTVTDLVNDKRPTAEVSDAITVSLTEAGGPEAPPRDRRGLGHDHR